jgi:hypothetical protein
MSFGVIPLDKEPYQKLAALLKNGMVWSRHLCSKEETPGRIVQRLKSKISENV